MVFGFFLVSLQFTLESRKWPERLEMRNHRALVQRQGFMCIDCTKYSAISLISLAVKIYGKIVERGMQVMSDERLWHGECFLSIWKEKKILIFSRTYPENMSQPSPKYFFTNKQSPWCYKIIYEQSNLPHIIYLI